MTQQLFPQGAALIIGGSGGLGAAIAQQFAIDGSDVALTYHSNESAGQAVAADITAKGRKASMKSDQVMGPQITQIHTDQTHSLLSVSICGRFFIPLTNAAPAGTFFFKTGHEIL